MKFTKILVGVDFSPASVHAFAYARALAGDGGPPWLVHVADAEATTSLATLAHLLGVPRDRYERLEVRVVNGGRPADEILRASAELGADVIVLGAHAGAMTRFFLGGVSEEVARRSRVPVCVVRQPPSDDARPIDRVVVAVDHDERSMVAARAGAELAARLGARLTAVHVISSSFIPPGYGAALDSPAYDVAPFVRDRCSIEREVAAAVGAETPVAFLMGSPASEIVTSSASGDVIVCGSHACSRLARLVFGSVTTGILRHAVCPVLVVPSPGAAGAAPGACVNVASDVARASGSP